jgi:ubiquitin-conjugating enzyme E2 D/E
MTNAKERIKKELNILVNDPPLNFIGGPINEDIFHWEIIITGPTGSDYEGGIFRMDIQFASSHPFNPPKVIFTTKIFHPNIFPDGAVCMDILKDTWTSSIQISTLLVSICSLLFDPNPDHAANFDAAQCYRSDHERYKKEVREWIMQFANDSGMKEKIDAAKERISSELNDIRQNPLLGVDVHPVDERDLFYWHVAIQGPQDSPYKDRSFSVNIRFPLDYPDSRPSFVFNSYIYHPNMMPHINLTKTLNWNAEITTRQYLQCLQTFLSHPDPLANVCDKRAAELYQANRPAYDEKAQALKYCDSNENWLVTLFRESKPEP